MMYGDWSGMMGGWGWFGGFSGLVILIDLTLLGIWLWKKINVK